TRGFNRRAPRAAQPQPIENGEDYHGGHGGHGEKEWFYSPSSVVAPRSLSPCPFGIKSAVSSVPFVPSVVMALRPWLWLRRSGSSAVKNPRSRRGKPRIVVQRGKAATRRSLPRNTRNTRNPVGILIAACEQF